MQIHLLFTAAAASHGLMPQGMSAAEWAVIGVILAVILWKVFSGPRRKEEREDAFARMGFREAPREQVFGTDWRAAAHVIRDMPDATISSWVGAGKSAAGNAALFEFSHCAGGSEAGGSIRFIVVAFSAPASIPDFEIAHHHLLDRFLNIQPPADANAVAANAVAANAPGANAPAVRKYGPFTVIDREPDKPAQKPVAIEGHPDFSKKYIVWSTDADLIRSMLSRDLMDQLVALDASNLHIRGGRGWLFVYHETSSSKPPAQYPALLEEAVQLVRGMQFPIAMPPT